MVPNEKLQDDQSFHISSKWDQTRNSATVQKSSKCFTRNHKRQPHGDSVNPGSHFRFNLILALVTF